MSNSFISYGHFTLVWTENLTNVNHVRWERGCAVISLHETLFISCLIGLVHKRSLARHVTQSAWRDEPKDVCDTRSRRPIFHGPDSTAAYNCLLSNCYICLMIFSPQSKNSEDTTQDYCILTSCKKLAWTGVLTPSFSFCSCAILYVSHL